MRGKYEIKALKLNNKDLENYSIINDESNRYISPLGKLNIFVGVNNSGKSRFLRGILKIEKILYLPASFDYQHIQKNAAILKKKAQEILDSSNIFEMTSQLGPDIRVSIESINLEREFGEEDDLVSKILDLYKVVENLKQRGHVRLITSEPRSGSLRYANESQVITALHSLCLVDFSEFRTLLDGVSKAKKFDRLYIPILRGLRPPIGIKDDIYEIRTIRDYFSKGEEFKYPNIKLFSGLHIYEAIKIKLLGTLKERNLVQQYEEYLSEKFFEGKSVVLIPRAGHDVLTIKIGKEVEKEIYNVGDGLQNIITITFPLFEHAKENKDEPLIACIEEPELLVHPGLQRTLMNELLSSPLYNNIQFFVTTHSNHFLDLSLDYEDVSIFRLKKELRESEHVEIAPRFSIENVNNKDKQTLEILGIKNSSVFLSNATIWVEGITDRMYLRHAFNLWQQNMIAKKNKVYREDAHYSFIEYSGANLSHWDFIEDNQIDQISLSSIVSNIFLIADNDIDETIEQKTTARKNKKDDRLKAIKKKMGINFYRLRRREVENLISPNILKNVAKEMGATKGLDKEITEDDYKDKRMGQYLKSTFGLESLADKYGAIKNKRKFAEKALGHMKTTSDLSSEMILICRKIQKFIEKNNKI